jgi:hypothetical protein
MMDPFTALGLAAGLVQFIDFGSRLISGSMERYRSVSGTSAGNVELESITEDLKSIVDNLETKPARPNTRQLSKLELTLEDLATKSKTAADELLVVLDDLKVRGRCKRLDSFIQAVRSIGKERKIQDLQKVLKTIERRLNTCLVAMIRCDHCPCIGGIVDSCALGYYH